MWTKQIRRANLIAHLPSLPLPLFFSPLLPHRYFHTTHLVLAKAETKPAKNDDAAIKSSSSFPSPSASNPPLPDTPRYLYEGWSSSTLVPKLHAPSKEEVNKDVEELDMAVVPILHAQMRVVGSSREAQKLRREQLRIPGQKQTCIVAYMRIGMHVYYLFSTKKKLNYFFTWLHANVRMRTDINYTQISEKIIPPSLSSFLLLCTHNSFSLAFCVFLVVRHVMRPCSSSLQRTSNQHRSFWIREARAHISQDNGAQSCAPTARWYGASCHSGGDCKTCCHAGTVERQLVSL